MTDEVKQEKKTTPLANKLREKARDSHDQNVSTILSHVADAVDETENADETETKPVQE